MECYCQSTEPIALLVVLSHSPMPALEAYSVTLLSSPSTTISIGWLLPVFTMAVTADAVTHRDMEYPHADRCRCAAHARCAWTHTLLRGTM